jgi:hypothetical protein
VPVLLCGGMDDHAVRVQQAQVRAKAFLDIGVGTMSLKEKAGSASTNAVKRTPLGRLKKID